MDITFKGFTPILEKNSLFYSLTVPSRQNRTKLLNHINVKTASKITPIQNRFVKINIHHEELSEKIGTNSFITILPDSFISENNISHQQILVSISDIKDGKQKVLVGITKDSLIVDFDFFQWELFLQNELYLNRVRPLFTRIPVPYYKISRPIRNLILNSVYTIRKMLKFFTNSKYNFPAWPIEYSLDAMRWLLWSAAAKLAGIDFVKTPYPMQKKFACLLTHDVDSIEAIDEIEKIREIERKYGFPSSWSLLSQKYQPGDSLLRKLIDDNCEVISHGYLHDGKLPYRNADEMRNQLNNIFIKYPWLKSHLYGYRSELLLRNEKLLEILPEIFVYDMSFPDTEMYGPYGLTSGCCTIYPFYNQYNMIEIPLTVPQDFYILFVHKLDLLKTWKNKIDYIEKFNGCAVINLHPDHIIKHPDLLNIYDEFLKYLAEKNGLITTPRRIFDFYHSLIKTDLPGKINYFLMLP